MLRGWGAAEPTGTDFYILRACDTKFRNWGVAEPTGTDFFSDFKRQKEPRRGGLFISVGGLSESEINKKCWGEAEPPGEPIRKIIKELKQGGGGLCISPLVLRVLILRIGGGARAGCQGESRL